jgi:4-amino-4-deoxy-L-arabinose transferase-like glycosyltransferase
MVNLLRALWKIIEVANLWLASHIYLIAIIFLAAFLRTISLDKIPNGFYTDEASIGYNAYSILLTGRDEHGELLPAYFRAFGEYKNPVYIYCAIPFIKVLGLNEFAVRLTSAMFGTLTVFFTYLLARELFDRKVALWAALLLTISPWHLQFSRTAFEAIALPCLFTVGLYFLLKGLEDGKHLIYSAILLALTLYTYAPAKAFVPLFLAGFIVLNHRPILKFKPELFSALLTASIILMPLLIYTVKGQGQMRFNTISIFNERSLNITKNGILNDRLWAPPFFKSLANNGAFLASYSFVRGYLLHASPNFLFFKGDSNLRHNIGKMGHLYKFEGIILIAGILFLILRREKKSMVLLWWLLLFPVASSLTYESIPHAIRSIYGLPAFQIVGAMGLVSVLGYAKRTIGERPRYKNLFIAAWTLAAAPAMALAASDLSRYFIRYYGEYPSVSYRYWNYGMREIIKTAQNLKSMDAFSFQGYFEQPYIYVLFYARYDPAIWQNTKRFDRYRFGNFVRDSIKRQALVVHAGQFPQYQTIRTILYPNGRAGYEIKEVRGKRPSALGQADVKPESIGGLRGSYFNGGGFNALLFSRIDRSINFDWGHDSPDPRVWNDNFSVRWNGLIKADRSDRYTFYTVSDDGVRLWIDGELVIGNWGPHAATEDRTEVYLDEGWHRISLEYNDIRYGAIIKFLWSTPTTGKSVVPPDHLSFEEVGGGQ